MAILEEMAFFVDPNRCIGCEACVQACGECDTHKGYSMIQLDYVDRAHTPQTVPMVCMHCESPTCADVCPAYAIETTEEGIVQTAKKPRCIACNNCVLACPFGIPKMNTAMGLMMKCNMCYDRTSADLKPMCASVCPSQALFFGTHEEIEQLRPNSKPNHTFRFGQQIISTKVHMMLPLHSPAEYLDALEAMFDLPEPRRSVDDALMAGMDGKETDEQREPDLEP